MHTNDLGSRAVDRAPSGETGQIQRGDHDALGRLSAQHRERVRAVCRRITGDDAGAGEALAATVAEVRQHVDASVDDQTFGPLLDKLATRAAWDVVRRRWRLTLASRPSYPPRLAG